MSRYKVNYSPLAKDDLRSIAAYIITTYRDRRSAKRIVDNIKAVIRSLDDMPNRFALLKTGYWQKMGMRRVAVGKYIVFYKVDEDAQTVDIARILFSGRNVEGLTDEP